MLHLISTVCLLACMGPCACLCACVCDVCVCASNSKLMSACLKCCLPTLSYWQIWVQLWLRIVINIFVDFGSSSKFQTGSLSVAHTFFPVPFKNVLHCRNTYFCNWYISLSLINLFFPQLFRSALLLSKKRIDMSKAGPKSADVAHIFYMWCISCFS